MDPEQLLQVTRTTMRAAEFCFLITLSESGAPNARLMEPFEPRKDLSLWFGSSPRSRKVAEIQRDARISVAFGHAADAAYVTLSGLAEVVDDIRERKRHWREEWAVFWPSGPAGDDYVLIKFVPSRIEVMNFARKVAPQPYGLRPAVLVRTGGAWVVAEGG